MRKLKSPRLLQKASPLGLAFLVAWSEARVERGRVAVGGRGHDREGESQRSTFWLRLSEWRAQGF
jgi:hypothetical protein